MEQKFRVSHTIGAASVDKKNPPNCYEKAILLHLGDIFLHYSEQIFPNKSQAIKNAVCTVVDWQLFDH